MSALGQKQTFAPQKAMSALPSIATAKADSRARSCPLYPRKRTFMSAIGLSGKGHKRISLSPKSQLAHRQNDLALTSFV